MDKSNKKRALAGTVVSDKMDKTVVVLVSTTKKHPKYHKEYKFSKKYHAHDPKNEYHVGDQVTIVESKPLSRLKRWTVLSNNTKKTE